jgi:ElaB/YqjD/DUF883 family membrane-anchored ribosome-binding protein
MGESADQLREEIEMKRQDASGKIEQIEQKVTDTADQVRGQVDQVKQTFDWRKQVNERPLAALGAAFIGGIVLSSILGEDDDDRDRRDRDRRRDRGRYSFDTVQYGEQGSTPSVAPAVAGLGVMGAVRKAAKTSGLEDTLNNMTSSFMSTVAERAKEVADRNFPGMADKLDNATKQANVGAGSTTQSASGMTDQITSTSSSTPTPTSAGDYARSGELGNTVSSG